MAFGNQNGEFDDVPKQIPYSATVENVENDVAVEPPQTDLEEAPSADIPANKTNENKRFWGYSSVARKNRKRNPIPGGVSLISPSS